MRALSIMQPWAWLIANGHKDVENRTWATGFRGRFLIHAGQKVDVDAYWWLRQCMPHVPSPPDAGKIERGGIVGEAEIYDSVTDHASPWFFGPHGFLIRCARPVQLVPLKGRLGFFPVDEETIAGVHRARG